MSNASDSSEDLRTCLGKFATGVTVVTCRGIQGPCGITANSFSTVSLDPPLILWSIAKVSNSLQAYLDADYFAVNVLSDRQRPLSSHFAQSDQALFGEISYETSAMGLPILPATLACIECRTHQIHECGDHYIIVGEVRNHWFDDCEPLIFFGGQYASISEPIE
jgi:flavin reductase (DIM6/NTAB) family NADH-FMN oxidoreductase RutF